MTTVSEISRPSLQSSPFDVLDVILLHIERPGDLLQLALTNRFFYELIISTHMAFRVIRCDILRVSVWQYLAERPTLAARLRALELTWEEEDPDTLIPSYLKLDSEPRGSDDLTTVLPVFLDALKKMTGLRRFVILSSALTGSSALNGTPFSWLDFTSICFGLGSWCPQLHSIDMEIPENEAKDANAVSQSVRDFQNLSMIVI